MSNQQVTLQLVRVKCVDETNGKYVEKLGNDEIWLGGVAVDATGAVSKIEPFSVYEEFDDNDVMEFAPPKPIASLSIPGGGTFPKSCVATLILSEKDYGDFKPVVEDFFKKVTEDMKEKKDDMGMDADDDPPQGFGDVLWEAARTWTYGYLKDRLLAGVQDDVFFPAQIIRLDVPSEDFYWPDGTKLSPEATVQFRDHSGVYYLAYYWEIKTVQGTRSIGGTRALDGSLSVGGVRANSPR